MQIDCTSLRFSLEDAAKLSQTENNGLLGRAADFLRGGPPNIEIRSAMQFYYPYYYVRMYMQLPRSKRVQTPAVEAAMIVDGVFGMVQGIEGTPQTERMDVPAQQVAKLNCSQQQAVEQVKEFVRRYIFRKYRVYPSFDSIEAGLVYKPLYAIGCRKRGKEYYQIVDGEMGCKDYVLDVRYSKITFCAAEP